MDKKYTMLFATVSDVIDQLSKAIFTANTCLELLKKSQQESEEIFLSETDAESETTCKCSEDT